MMVKRRTTAIKFANLGDIREHCKSQGLAFDRFVLDLLKPAGQHIQDQSNVDVSLQRLRDLLIKEAKNNFETCLVVGEMYENGHGVARDYAAAEKYYLKASYNSRLSQDAAQLKLASLYADKDKFENGMAEAFRLYAGLMFKSKGKDQRTWDAMKELIVGSSIDLKEGHLEIAFHDSSRLKIDAGKEMPLHLPLVPVDPRADYDRRRGKRQLGVVMRPQANNLVIGFFDGKVTLEYPPYKKEIIRCVKASDLLTGMSWLENKQRTPLQQYALEEGIAKRPSWFAGIVCAVKHSNAVNSEGLSSIILPKRNEIKKVDDVHHDDKDMFYIKTLTKPKLRPQNPGGRLPAP